MDLITLARAGDPFPGSAFDAPCHRIPALAVTASGRVLAAWDVRAGKHCPGCGGNLSIGMKPGVGIVKRAAASCV